MPETLEIRTLERKNAKGLALSSASSRPVTPSGNGRQEIRKVGQSRSAIDLDTLEITVEFRLDLMPEDFDPHDLDILEELSTKIGSAMISKVKHMPTGVIMARKIIPIGSQSLRKQITRELRVMHDCHSEYLLEFLGVFQNHDRVVMCTEYMDIGSLNQISRKFGPIRIDVLGQIAVAVLGGLNYLYSKHRIMHRDLRPSKILVNSLGQIKLRDFGMSGELLNSIAETAVGMSTYMSPERIQGQSYTVKSDVWSFGLTLFELAVAKFPFSKTGEAVDILTLLTQIVYEPSPKLPESDAFPRILDDIIDKCLLKEPNDRPSPKELFEIDRFILAAKRTPVDLVEWAASVQLP